jgi:hypothetical protein
VCDWVAKEETEFLQVVDRRCRAGDDFLFDCHCVGLVVHKYDAILVLVNCTG